MCGIVGKINLDKKRLTDSEIKTMIKELSYRGPDDQGTYINGNVGLGHARLSIIDLSPLGHQPMFNEDKSIAIVFNGEIYNFQELKKDLENKGHKFRSHSDTEVIIHLYEQYGEKESLKKMRGMFAFAIWDQNKQKLFAARDRVGKKPLKYYFDGKRFIFASELKAILTQGIKKEPDYLAIHHYLSYQYVPAPMTGFKNIKKLPAAHYLVLEKNKLKIERYWQIDYSKKLDLSEAEWKKRILKKLEESVKLRMISDVPLGAFLSGGVDSSAIVAMMSKLSKKPIKTFSIGFNEQTHNELPYAKIIANKFKTDHTELIVDPRDNDLLKKLVWHYEEPYADSSAWPTYLVSKLCRKYVTVALNGDGGDENFAGYARYTNFQLFYKKFHRYLPRSFWEKVFAPTASFGSKIFKTNFTQKVFELSERLGQTEPEGYFNFMCYFTNRQKEILYNDKFRQKLLNHNSFSFLEKKFKEAKKFDWLDQLLYVDFNTYLPDDLLVKVDIAAAANALEGRSPLLDHEFLELTAQIPSNLKIKGNERKYIFKKALEGLIPNDILYRPKQGFGIPIADWFRGDLKEYSNKLLLAKDAKINGFCNPESIKTILISHQSGRKNYARQIWALLVLEIWLETFF